MAEFSLDVDGITNDVEKSLQKEEEKLENSNFQDQADKNAVAIFDADFTNPQERDSIIKPLDNFGLGEMTKSANHNELLATRFVDLTKGGKDADNIGEKLLELNKQVKDLDPSGIDFTKKGFLGSLMNPIRKYFAKYEKAERDIANIVE